MYIYIYIIYTCIYYTCMLGCDADPFRERLHDMAPGQNTLAKRLGCPFRFQPRVIFFSKLGTPQEMIPFPCKLCHVWKNVMLHGLGVKIFPTFTTQAPKMQDHDPNVAKYPVGQLKDRVPDSINLIFLTFPIKKNMLVQPIRRHTHISCF